MSGAESGGGVWGVSGIGGGDGVDGMGCGGRTGECRGRGVSPGAFVADLLVCRPQSTRGGGSCLGPMRWQSARLPM